MSDVITEKQSHYKHLNHKRKQKGKKINVSEILLLVILFFIFWKYEINLSLGICLYLSFVDLLLVHSFTK